MTLWKEGVLRPLELPGDPKRMSNAVAAANAANKFVTEKPVAEKTIAELEAELATALEALRELEARAALPAESTLERLYAAVGLDRLYRPDRGDAGKPVSATPGDDHILVRISVDGQLTVCHTEPDV